MTEAFRKGMRKKSDLRGSRLVFALDISDHKNLLRKAIRILEETSEYLAGAKIGYPLVLGAGLKVLTKAKEVSGLPIIADFKVADVPHVNQLIAKNTFDAGACAVIVHTFLGRDSLEAVVEIADKVGGGVIALPNMSHPGSKSFIRPVSQRMARMAMETGCDGLIAPATRPYEISELRSAVGNEPLIFSPGIGAQGGKPGDAVNAGADFEIVGRTIYNSKNPRRAAKDLRDWINDRLKD